MVRVGLKRTRAEVVFSWFNTVFLLLVTFVMMIPLLAVASISLSSSSAVNTGKVFIFPVSITSASWEYIITLNRLWKSLLLTVGVTLAGTFLSLVLNLLLAYPLSKKEFAPGRFMLMGMAVTMIFRAPIIPYFLTVRSIGLFDHVLVMIIPHLYVTYYLFIMVTFLRQIPRELEEAAMIEGCGYLKVLFWVILPSSMALVATIGLFYAVMYWNQFMHPLLFIQNHNLYPLQLVVRTFVTGDEVIVGFFRLDRRALLNDKTVKAAVVIFSVLPVILVYPFVQKYFVKGAMVGSIKG